NNGGIVFGDLAFTTDDIVQFYAAGYDQYGNFISDVSVDWSTLGGLESATGSGTSFSFSPSLGGGVTGTVQADHATVTDDATGTLTVNNGILAELKIQTENSANGHILGDTSLTFDQSLTLYSWGYDADGNSLGLESSIWTLNSLSGSLSGSNPATSRTYSPQGASTGSISAASNANGDISDNSGSISTTAGNLNYVTIRTEANNGGIVFGDLAFTTDDIVQFYAAGYDQYGNFISDVSVDWSTLGGLE
ncbi:MAG: hypothetical protein GY712_05565, partial [Oceanicoccus sp.]|uniref:hypothetical protein n=1 Tax=Oceanicoccus sp. TaxID=2691044 RepID=UPI00260E4AE8